MDHACKTCEIVTHLDTDGDRDSLQNLRDNFEVVCFGLMRVAGRVGREKKHVELEGIGAGLLDFMCELRPLMGIDAIDTGDNGDRDAFLGLLDEVGIFSVVLSKDVINRVMNEGLAKVASAVSSADKLATSWAEIKKQQ